MNIHPYISAKENKGKLRQSATRSNPDESRIWSLAPEQIKLLPALRSNRCLHFSPDTIYGFSSLWCHKNMSGTCLYKKESTPFKDIHNGANGMRNKAKSNKMKEDPTAGCRRLGALESWGTQSIGSQTPDSTMAPKLHSQQPNRSLRSMRADVAGNSAFHFRFSNVVSDDQHCTAEPQRGLLTRYYKDALTYLTAWHLTSMSGNLLRS
jgi:hypothetical protein